MNDATFHVAQVCTVVHYTMGGLAINNESQVTSEGGPPTSGLYAAGEVAGGIHGRNRLGGNSLLDCVVFGRVAGDTACRHLLTSAIKALRTGGPASNSSETALNRVASINAHLNLAGRPPARSSGPAPARRSPRPPRVRRRRPSRPPPGGGEGVRRRAVLHGG